MLNFDPHRWIAENGANPADPELAGLSGLAGIHSENENRAKDEKVVWFNGVVERTGDDRKNAILERHPANPAKVANPAVVLRDWHRHLSKLNALRGPDCLTSGEWADLCDDAWWLYETHASAAVRQGWTAQGLWGVRVDYPAGGGLAQYLRTSRKVMFADGAAYVSRFGVTSQRNTMMGVGLPLMWEFPR